MPPDLAIPKENNHISLHDWFKLHGRAGQRSQLHTFHFHQSVPFPQPKTVEKKLHWYFRRCAAIWKANTLFPALSVAVIENGRLYGDRGVVLTPENKMIKHVSFKDILDGKTSLPPPRYTNKTVAVLSFRYPENYFHWMFDVLPRIALIRKCKLHIDKYVISPPGRFPYKEMLSALGIPESKVIVAGKDFHIKAKRLVVAEKFSRWKPYQHVYPQWASRFLREQLSPCNKKPPSPKYERIYVSRAHAGGRRVRNEKEVVKLLDKYGFRRIHPESMPFAEQIRAFQSARTIVSPHGASLANLVFANPGTKLIEIFSPNYVRDYYLGLSSHMKLDYYYLIGTGKRPPREHRYTKALYEDITVDLEALKQILQKADIPRI